MENSGENMHTDIKVYRAQYNVYVNCTWIRSHIPTCIGFIEFFTVGTIH